MIEQLIGIYIYDNKNPYGKFAFTINKNDKDPINVAFESYDKNTLKDFGHKYKLNYAKMGQMIFFNNFTISEDEYNNFKENIFGKGETTWKIEGMSGPVSINGSWIECTPFIISLDEIDNFYDNHSPSRRETINNKDDREKVFDAMSVLLDRLYNPYNKMCEDANECNYSFDIEYSDSRDPNSQSNKAHIFVKEQDKDTRDITVLVHGPKEIVNDLRKQFEEMRTEGGRRKKYRSRSSKKYRKHRSRSSKKYRKHRTRRSH
jgi:hypothetical protein